MKHSSIALLIITALSLNACGGGEDTKEDPIREGEQTVPTTPAPPKDQTDGQETDEPVNPPAQQPISSISEAMDRLVGIGAIPKLNRDDDVAGPDADANGVRDDLDAYVASLPDSELQKKAMLQDFASTQFMMTLDTLNEESVKEGLRLMSASMECLYIRYDSLTAHKRSKEIETYSVNTEARTEAYDRFNKAASGYVISEPDGEPCIE